MSLINDALKRARDLHQKNAPPVAPPLPPVETKKHRRRDGNWFLPALIFLLIVTAFFFFTLAMEKRTVTKIVNAPEISSTQQVESDSEAATNPPFAPLPAQIGLAAITGASVTTPEQPRVQGIFYDPVHPSAIIDGKSVSPGSIVGGMRVMKISRDSVTLIGNGKTNTLIVGE